MSGVAVDWTINIGNVVQLLVLLGGGLATIGIMKSDLRLLTYRIDQLEKRFDLVYNKVMSRSRNPARRTTDD